MSSAVVELDNTLSSMLALKGGVSGAKIQTITSLCNANVKDEPVLIQKLYAHFKKAEANKKLGVLYVIDSVTRQWVEQARKAGQTIGHGAGDGTYAAGVTHVSELLPALMHDIITVVPDEQREKVQKLITIWEKAGTFAPHLLQSFREKLNAAPAQSTTPTSTPPPQALPISQSQQPKQQPPQGNPGQSTSAILASLQALAAASRGATTAAATTQQVPPAMTTMLIPAINTVAANANDVAPLPPIAVAPSMFIPPMVPAVNLNNGGGAMYGSFAPQMMPVPGMYNPVAAQVLSFPPPPPPSQPQGLPPQDNTILQQQMLILQALQAQGIPHSEWPKVLGAIAASTNALPVPPPNFAYQQQTGGAPDGQGFEGIRSPPSNHRGDKRSRSRSPHGNGRRDGSPNGRHRSPNRNGNGRKRRGGRNNDRRSPSPQRFPENSLSSAGPKWIEFDHTIPKDHIKVYSRTLFVGGVNCSDNELRQIFSQAGQVQSCVGNIQKRHAFVKMLTRKDAETAKTTFERYKAGDMQLRTRWAVGFGPRDASDYPTGISIISLERLTDADQKWLLKAEHGGTGGREVESGMCIEEPDIEIGAGVSSKAISRRMQTDRSGTAGPRSDGMGEAQGGRRGNNTRGKYHQHENSTPNIQAPPTVPSFGFQLPANFTMPQALALPPGYSMPNGQQSSNSGGS